MESLGYDAAYRLTPASTITPVPVWDDAFSWDGEFFDTARPVLLDVGAAGKGYLVDLVSALLLDLGFATHVVDAQRRSGRARGDVGGGGAGASRRPVEGDRRGPVADGALAASAQPARWGDGLHHVLDAITGLPTASVIATWALAPDAMHADGLATALFFEPAPGLLDGTERGVREDVRRRARGPLAVLPRRVFA